MLIDLSLGLQLDTPMADANPFVWKGYNIRVRAGNIETIGLFGPMLLKDSDGPVVLPTVGDGTDLWRTIFTSPSPLTGQILAGSVNAVNLIEFDPTSATIDRRWAVYDLTPVNLAATSDALTSPNSGRVDIPPAWWFVDQDDVVVGGRADVIEVPWIWDRNSANPLIELGASAHPDPGNPVPTPVPKGAVAGGVINRILVLLGCDSFAPTISNRYMTVRWSDRFDFGQWTPSDITVSGELQLDGGSRIVGGGVTGFGVIAWTDRRMALLSETFDPDSVFNRRYIDGGRGLLSNRAWTEVDGQVFWLDESRTLNVFDGGRPRQIINPLRMGTIETLNDDDVARVYMAPNAEFGEVIIFYSPDGADATVQLVYNYLHDRWYFWTLPRVAWGPRYGIIPNVAISPDGAVWEHDLNAALASPWIPMMADGVDVANVSEANVEPFSFSFETNLIVQPEPSYSSWNSTKLMVDHLPAPATGAVDTFEVEVIGYREPSYIEPTASEVQSFAAGQSMADYRVGGKAIQIRISGTDIKTVFRYGKIDIAGGQDSER